MWEFGLNDVTVTQVAIAAGMLTAGLGGLMTTITPWYRGLRVPSWKPPDWAFGPIWTVIIGLSVWGGILGWNNAQDQGQRDTIAWAFAANAVLNVLWSLLFFRLKRPDWSLIEAVPLWLSILTLIVMLAPISTNAALLLAPYLIWVSIANCLNLAIVRLNGPFGPGPGDRRNSTKIDPNGRKPGGRVG